MNCYVFKGTRKGLMIAIAAVAVGLGAGVAVLWATGDVKADSGLSPGFIKGTNPAKPDPKMIEEGKKIYFRKCVWCHGVDGAGDGPGADRLWPRPRNFNQGTFKIRHTASGELPLFDPTKPVAGQNDLFDTVTHALPGSPMPPWDGILTEQQRLQVLSVVKTQHVQDRKYDDKTETFSILNLKHQNAFPARRCFRWIRRRLRRKPILSCLPLPSKEKFPRIPMTRNGRIGLGGSSGWVDKSLTSRGTLSTGSTISGYSPCTTRMRLLSSFGGTTGRRARSSLASPWCPLRKRRL